MNGTWNVDASQAFYPNLKLVLWYVSRFYLNLAAIVSLAYIMSVTARTLRFLKKTRLAVGSESVNSTVVAVEDVCPVNIYRL